MEWVDFGSLGCFVQGGLWRLQCLHPFCLPPDLRPSSMCSSHLGRTAVFAPLACSAPWGCSQPVSTTTSGGALRGEDRAGRTFSLSLPLLDLLFTRICPPSEASGCLRLLCGAEQSLLNCSWPSGNFKGRDSEVLSGRRTSDVVPKFLLELTMVLNFCFNSSRFTLYSFLIHSLMAKHF